jgi:hypothetical protein
MVRLWLKSGSASFYVAWQPLGAAQAMALPNYRIALATHITHSTCTHTSQSEVNKTRNGIKSLQRLDNTLSKWCKS